jgi:hypothetical protein
VYSKDLNKWPDSAAKVAAILNQAGAEVKVATRMHSKTLAVDGSWIVEGSFNWLSAVRQEGRRFQNQEASLLQRGANAPDFIRKAWREAAGVEIPTRAADS